MLTAIFTYNRAEYLDNCVRSAREFGGEADILVVDDASTEPAQRSLLDRIEAEGIATVWRMQGAEEQRGGLYRNMNHVLEYAAEFGFQYVNFVQDDMQYVSPSGSSVADAMRIFRNRPDALQVSLTLRKILDVRPGPAPDYENGWYVGQRMSASATGIMDVSKVIASGFRFGESEDAASGRARQLGFRSYVVRDPCIAFVPWPRHHRFRRAQSATRGPRLTNSYMIVPLSEADRRQLEQRPLDVLPVAEDYCWPSTGCWLVPFGFDRSYAMWVKRMAKVAERGEWSRRHWPHLRFPRGATRPSPVR